MKINNIAVAHKLWALFIGITLALLLVALGVLWNIERIEQRESQAQAASAERLALTQRWKALASLTSERIAVHMMSSEAHVGAHIQRLNAQATNEVNALREAIGQQLTDSAQRQLLEQVDQQRANTRAVAGRARQARDAGDNAQATRIVQTELLSATAQYEQMQQRLISLQEQALAQARLHSQAALRQGYWLAAGISATVIALGLWLAWGLMRSITQPLAQAVGLAQRIAQGDLTGELHTQRQDELGQLLHSLSAMTHKLRTVVGEVRQGVTSVAAASSQIATGNLDLSNRTEQTASSLQETAASMEQLTATVSQSFETARQANQLVSSAAHAAEQGGSIVGQVVQSMEHITDSSRRISDIIGVIDSIAFQTNILALNAAVEAARAGEQGRGFAVVASEVRSLAGRSAEAAKEIKHLITTSVRNVEAGSQQVAQAGTSMQEIVHSVRRVSDLMGEITAATAQQRDGITQVNQAVGQLDQMTQQNAALVEESSAAANGMREQAHRLESVVAQFDVGHQATAAASTARRPSSAAPSAPALAPAPLAPAAANAAPSFSRASAPAPRKLGHAAKASAVANSANDDWESF